MVEFLSIKLQTYSVQAATLTDTFLKMYQTLAVLTNHILRKKSMVDQIPNKVVTL